MRKGLYEGNNRKEWLTITEAEKTQFMEKLNAALKVSGEVNQQYEQALKEFADIEKVQEV